MTRTTIGIIGAGHMGSAFAKRLVASGHDVAITARDRARAEKAAAAAGGHARAVDQSELAGTAELLILATPYTEAVDALRAVGDVDGKTILDITNPLKPDLTGLVVGHETSAAEEIQRAVPGARVVKAFNTIFENVLAHGARAQVLYAGDDPNAKQQVRSLIESIGFEPVDAGPLANARQLEPVAMLTIYLGYVGGRGTGVAPSWLPTT